MKTWLTSCFKMFVDSWTSSRDHFYFSEWYNYQTFFGNEIIMFLFENNFVMKVTVFLVLLKLPGFLFITWSTGHFSSSLILLPILFLFWRSNCQIFLFLFKIQLSDFPFFLLNFVCFESFLFRTPFEITKLIQTN